MTAIQPLNQGPGSNAFPSNVRGIAGPLMILLLARAGWMVLMKLLNLVGLSLGRFLPYQLLMWLPTLIALAAVICYFIWGVRVINTLRARGEQTNYSPGFSVGAWFIPFANLGFAPMILADLWRRATRSPAGIVALWWTAYLLYIILDNVMMNMRGGFGGGMGVYTVLSWLTWLADIAAYGLWYLIVRKITEALENPPPAGGMPGYGQPGMGGSVQRS
jgi:hypothetical protein